MNAVSIIALAILAILAIIFVGALFYVALVARCMNCPHQDECQANKDFKCPYQGFDNNINQFNNPGGAF